MIYKQQDCFTDFTFTTVLLTSLACAFSQSLSVWNKSGSKLQYYALGGGGGGGGGGEGGSGNKIHTVFVCFVLFFK